MKKKPNQSTSPAKGWVAGFLTAGVIALGYASIFPLHRLWDYVIVSALALLGGRVAYIMGSGLDTSRKAPAMDDLPATGDETVDRMIQRGQELLQAIRQENDRIPDPVLSAKVNQLEAVSGQIFRTVIEQPQKAPQIRRFMDYYLPTTLKMLTGYRQMDERGVKGENADVTRRKIEDAMDVVLSAFKKQLDTLYHDNMLDISTDIDVLETMLKQDSLIGQGVAMRSTRQTDQAQAKKEG